MNRKSLHIIIGGIIIALLIVAFGYGYSLYQASVNADISSSYQVKQVKIDSGESVFSIASKLESSDIISSKLFFYWKIFITGSWSKLLPGDYLIANSNDVDQIIEILTSGSSDQIKLAIKEGSTIKQIDSRLFNRGLIEKEGDFIDLDRPKLYQDQYSFIYKGQKGLEGYLFPDTYYVLCDDFEPEQFLVKMLDNFNRKIYHQHSKDRLPNELDTFDDLIKLASIGEKEASSYEDRRIVAGIFIKRLKRNMLLQSCSTINYTLDEPKTILELEDISIDSKYNGYRYKGLPPTPISNPSASSVKATINYRKTNYLYFLSDENGKIHYSSTVKEHRAKKERYL